MSKKNAVNFHILIAEDDTDDAETIKHVFEENEKFHTVDLVSNGEELICYLKNNANQLPDIILTDFNMPLKNAYEVLLEISAKDEFRSIPVFVYSTTINPTYVLQCKALGAREFLIKPFNLKDFTLIPEKIISNLQQTGN